MISQKSRFILYGIIAVIIVFLRFLNKPEPLPIIGKIPQFEMRDSRNESFGSNDLYGNIWVADFIFTTCAGPCPVMTTEMYKIHQTFINDPIVKTITYTVNPDYDTPEILSGYAERYNADTEQWHFLTAPYEDLQFIIKNGFKMGDIEEIVFHSTKFALVDGDMNIRGYYTGTEPDEVDKLIEDIKNLKKE